MVDDIRTDLRGQTGDETVHENQRPIDERRQVRDNRRVLRDGEGGSQGDIGGVTSGRNTTAIEVELVEYFRANQTKGIPTLSGRPDSSTDILDFENAVKRCYHRVSPFNANFVGAVLDQLEPPARAHLETSGICYYMVIVIFVFANLLAIAFRMDTNICQLYVNSS
uniref:Uncharacterized protein n=1 Tax=Bracon brevicornis TaxID=1563983 RepID=A0A6V7KQS1_9HYME